MVGSLMNWWSPPPKDAVKGRAFNLSSGKVLSTEEIYKHKMQIQESSYNEALRVKPHHQGPYKSSLKKPSSPEVGGSGAAAQLANGPMPPVDTEQGLTTPGDSPQPSPKGSLVIKSPQTSTAEEEAQ
jgi:hypothetical protein